MARRMFSPQIVDSDAFLDMSPSAQNLYFHLGMRADDDGFVGNPKKILRMIGGNDDDLRLLLAKRFILTFESGVIVIKHWRINNLVRKDWYRPTQYTEEMESLVIKENGSYTEQNPGLFIGNESVTKLAHRLGKDRLGKDREEKPHSHKKYLLSIPEEDLKELREKYEASVSQVKRKAEQMHNYCEAKGKIYKNYRAFLENGLDKDFGRRVKVLAHQKEPEPVLTQEQKEAVDKKKAEISAMFKVAK